LAKGINGRSENTQILTASENFQITASGGSVFLQASDDIRIEGDGSGDIIIENGGGGIKMDADGNVTLFGNVISFNKDNVTFNGNVSYDIESPPSPPSVEVEAPKELVEVDEFELENFQAPVRSNTIITHRDKLTGEPLAGAPYLVITPEKDIIRGTLDENGQARINHPSPEQCKVILLSENTERLEQ
jgi:type VI secretion system secreted protein VgrG